MGIQNIYIYCIYICIYTHLYFFISSPSQDHQCRNPLNSFSQLCSYQKTTMPTMATVSLRLLVRCMEQVIQSVKHHRLNSINPAPWIC